MNSVEGICPRCKCRHYGPALNQRRNQLCVKCGSALLMKRDGIHVPRGNLPVAREYKINLKIDVWEQMRQKVTFFLSRN
jgi:hypothetical protein